MDEIWWPGRLYCTSFSKPRRKRSGWICDWKAEQAEITFGITKYRARVMVVGPGGHMPALFHGKHEQNLCKRHIAMWIYTYHPLHLQNVKWLLNHNRKFWLVPSSIARQKDWKIWRWQSSSHLNLVAVWVILKGFLLHKRCSFTMMQYERLWNVFICKPKGTKS